MEREIKHVDTDKPKEENKPLSETAKEIKEVKKAEITTDDKASIKIVEEQKIDDHEENLELFDYVDESEEEKEEEEEEVVDVHDPRFKIGRKVKRGPDWRYGSQDLMMEGCGFGVIIHVDKMSDSVWVQWKTRDGKNAHRNIYPAGSEDIDYTLKTYRRFYALTYVKEE